MTPPPAPEPEPSPSPPRSGGDPEESVEERLLRMKNTSELMIDLAYSALLYRSRDIADEVRELEEDVDEIFASVVRDAIDAHKREDVPMGTTLTILGLANAAEVLADSALEIADVLLRDVELHPVLSMAVEESDVTIARVAVREGSALAGTSLGAAHVAKETGMRVIAIRRGGKTRYGPTKKTRVEVGDVLFARGPPDAEDKLRELAGDEKREWDED